MDQVKVFEEHRPLLFSIAYRMLGMVMEAEDVLQEAFLRWQRADADEVESPKSYLASVVARLCIDQLRSARVQRENYIGPWLPEPVVTDSSADPLAAVELSESLSMAFLVVLESLNPVERAIFLLHEVFDYDFATIAGIVGKSEANCRQIASRARHRVDQKRPRFEVSSDQQTRVLEEFMNTVTNGDIHGLMAVLDDDVTWWSDGGGMPRTAKKPIHGAEKVARFALNLVRLAPEGIVTKPAEINGAPGLILYLDDKPYSTISFDIVGNQIVTIRAVVNPDKLRSLPPLE